MIEISIQKQLQSSEGEMLLDLQVRAERKSLVTLYGKSGAGKTSILRMLAGLMTPDKGRIMVNGSAWFDSERGIDQPPQKRKIGFVFQDYALFPNMTVKDNLIFAGGGDSENIVKDLIELTELKALENRKPGTLSGGQQQRVALARALVQRPEILMLDEPLSALDREMRLKLQHYILDLHREFELTTILVSHDISEILKMSDRIIELDHGKVVREGTPGEVFTSREISGKFQFTGEVIEIKKQDFLYIISILIGKDLVKVIADEKEGSGLQPGDKVLVASKAFNPVIRKIE